LDRLAFQKFFKKYLNNETFLFIRFIFWDNIMLIKFALDFLIYIICVDIFILVLEFGLEGSFYFFPLSLSLNFNQNNVIFICLFNFILLLYIYGVKRMLNNSQVYNFKFEELICLIILHFCSIFLVCSENIFLIFIIFEIISYIFYINANFYTSDLFGRLKFSKTNILSEVVVKYFIGSIVSSTLILLGICLLYVYTGLDNIFELINYLNFTCHFSNEIFFDKYVILSLIFILIGFSFKLSIFPLHSWIISLYTGIVTHILFFFSSITKIVYLFIFVKVFYPLYLNFDLFSIFFLFLGFSSILFSIFYGLWETKLNKLLAYSSILNTGYSFVVLSNLNMISQAISLFNLIVYALLILLLFIVIVDLNKYQNNEKMVLIRDFRFLFSQGFVFSYGLLLFIVFSIIGIPPLIGFFPKFMIFMELYYNGKWFLSFFFFFLTIMSAGLYLRLINFVYFVFVKNIKFEYFFLNHTNKLKFFMYLIVGMLVFVNVIFILDIFIEFLFMLIVLIFI
jgi:NADH-quinone oxidoreductase subunit N